MICSGAPQPIDGRCWNTPSESASPQSRLFMCDSTHPASNPASITLSLTPRERPTACTTRMTSASCTPGTRQETFVEAAHAPYRP